MNKPCNAEAQPVDLLSSLSDELLHKILFSLPAKDAAATCILSRRWRHLWTTSPDLCIDSRDFLIDEYKDDLPPCATFARFVDRALLRRKRDASIRTFCLRIGKNVTTDNDDVDAWLRYAIEHGVQEIDLVITDDEKFSLPIPDHNFVLTSLQKLHIDTISEWSVLGWPKSLRLPSLTYLNLSNLRFEDKIGKDNIFKNCPQLRILKIKNCSRVHQLDVVDCPLLEEVELECLSELEECNVKSDKLKSLVMESYSFGTIKVNAPNLKRFKWMGEPGYLFSFAQQSPSLPCLDFASFDMWNVHDRSVRWEDSMVSLVRFANAKQLVINDMVEAFYMAIKKNQERREFALTNIQHIQITLCLQPEQVDSLYFLLRSLSSLQTLAVTSMDKLEKQEINAQGSLKIEEGFLETLSLSLSNLSEVKFGNFRGTTFETDFVQFLLGSVNSLRRMDVQLSKNTMQKDRIEYEEKIRKFQIVSSRCHVFIY